MNKKYVGITTELREKIESIGENNVTNYVETTLRELLGMEQLPKSVRQKEFTGNVLVLEDGVFKETFKVENMDVTDIKKKLYGYVETHNETETVYVTNVEKLPKMLKAIYPLVVTD